MHFAIQGQRGQTRPFKFPFRNKLPIVSPLESVARRKKHEVDSGQNHTMPAVSPRAETYINRESQNKQLTHPSLRVIDKKAKAVLE